MEYALILTLNDVLLVAAKRKADLKMFENRKRGGFAGEISSSLWVQIPPVHQEKRQ